MSEIDYASTLESVHRDILPRLGDGAVADYIPALAAVPKDKFGMAICTTDGRVFSCGDAEETFSIQSISKVFALLQALDLVGSQALWERVGREPSGTAFNSLIQLESEHGIPRNPFINSGALVVTDAITAQCVDPASKTLGLVRRLAGNPDIHRDEEVARSEALYGHRNAAIAHMLKAQDNLKAPVSDVLDAYFRQCAIAMSCIDLARAFLPLANGGRFADGRTRAMSASRAKRVNALMLTCGLYDGVGNFAYRVGIPAKSGVGGGIVGVVPSKCAIAVWSPALDDEGNSKAGAQAFEWLAQRTDLSIF